MKFLKNLLYLFLLVFLISNIYATKVGVVITENAVEKELVSGYYKLSVSGTLEIKNPSNVSKIYEYTIPLEFDSLIGFSWKYSDDNFKYVKNNLYLNKNNSNVSSNLNNTNVSIDINQTLKENNLGSLNNLFNTSLDFSSLYNTIHGYIIEPGKSVKIDYKIYGILSDNLKNNLNSSNESVLQYYAKNFNFLTNLKLNIEKPEREGNLKNLDGSINKTLGKNVKSTRLVTIQIRNPTDFSCILNRVDLYRTNVSDPFFNYGSIIYGVKDKYLKPFDYDMFNYFDKQSNDYSVYWLSTKFSLEYDLNSNVNFDFIALKSLNNSSSLINESIFSEKILFKKNVNMTLIRKNDTFKVILSLVNLKNESIYNLSIFDEIPSGYDLMNVSDEFKLIGGNKLIFKFNNLSGYGIKKIEYVLLNKNRPKGITYLKPAELYFGNESYFTDGVLLVNELLPDKKLFIQKKIDSYDDNYDKVTIKVKNMGSVRLSNLLIVDNIDGNAVVKDISKMFYEKGTWKIKQLFPGEDWEVSYLIEKNLNLANLPSVFGVDKSDVFGTVISSGEVVTIYKDQPRTIEKIGMGFAVALLVFYLLF